MVSKEYIVLTCATLRELWKPTSQIFNRCHPPASIFKDGKKGGMMENWGYTAAACAANLIKKGTAGHWTLTDKTAKSLDLAMC